MTAALTMRSAARKTTAQAAATATATAAAAAVAATAAIKSAIVRATNADESESATGIGIETRPVMLVATLAVQELDTVCRVVAAHVRVRRTMIAPRVPLLCVLNATSRATARATAIILRVATTAATAD